MKKTTRKKNITAIKKKYFLKNPELTNEQIQKLINITNEYLSSNNLKYEPKIKGKILQSMLSLVFLNQRRIAKEVKEKESH